MKPFEVKPTNKVFQHRPRSRLDSVEPQVLLKDLSQVDLRPQSADEAHKAHDTLHGHRRYGLFKSGCAAYVDGVIDALAVCQIYDFHTPSGSFPIVDRRSGAQLAQAIKFGLRTGSRDNLCTR